MNEIVNNNGMQVIPAQNQQQNQKTAVAMFLEKESFETAMRVAGMFSHSDLVPDQYQYKQQAPETDAQGNIIEANKRANDAARSKATANCMIALNKAQQMGVDVLTIMQNMVVVHGRPCWSSSFLIGTVNSCGRFMPLKFKFGEEGKVKAGATGPEMKNMTCYAYTTERGSDEVLVGTTISMKMALDEGWLTKNGSKWKTMPQQMLMYRAAAFWVRAYAPEVSLGFSHTADELQDAEFTPYEEVGGGSGAETVAAAVAAADAAEAPAFAKTAEEPSKTAPDATKAEQPKFGRGQGPQIEAPFMN